MNYTTNIVTRDANELESSILLQENGLADLSSRAVVEHQLPFRRDSDLEENFTSTEDSSEENINPWGQAEVGNFPGSYQSDIYP